MWEFGNNNINSSILESFEFVKKKEEKVFCKTFIPSWLTIVDVVWSFIVSNYRGRETLLLLNFV